MRFEVEEEPATAAEPETEPEAKPTAAQRPPSDGWLWLLAVCSVVFGLIIAGLVAWSQWPDNPEQLTQADVDSAIDRALAAQSPPPASRATGAVAFDQIAASVVTVRALHDEVNDSATPAANLGSGVIINDAGEILTANHVISDADSIEVTFVDGTTTIAVLVAQDTATDIAVLRANAKSALVVPAEIGSPHTLQVGDEIFAVGNPLGLTGTLSAGVVSGLRRDIPFPGDTDLVLEDLIQFDAAVNQGSSGGPLLNADGQVVGIVTALANPDGQGVFLGIGFAVPIDVASRHATG